MKTKTIQVFEHEALAIDGRHFKENHFNQLVAYNEKHKDQFFTVGYKKITFKSYVGVLQIGKLTIEILPKADKTSHTSNKRKWHNALLNLLKACKYIRLKSFSNAHLKLRSSSLIDLYFHAFLNEVETLVHKGLVKNYQLKEGNVSKLKGKILFQQQITQNLVRKERFYTRHQTYNKNHIYNQILKKALSILTQIAANSHIHSRACQYSLDFEKISDAPIQAATFERLSFNRKNEHYQYALKLAKLIILQYSPDLQGGNNEILAILFDMNRLYEEFILGQLKKSAANYSSINLQALGQVRSLFWQGKTIRPDIVLTYERGGQQHKIILDTKWKVLTSPQPSDNDLKQIYTYNLHLGAQKGALLYPKSSFENSGFQSFEDSDFSTNLHSCQIYFTTIFDEEGDILKDVGDRILKDLLEFNE